MFSRLGSHRWWNVGRKIVYFTGICRGNKIVLLLVVVTVVTAERDSVVRSNSWTGKFTEFSKFQFWLSQKVFGKNVPFLSFLIRAHTICLYYCMHNFHVICVIKRIISSRLCISSKTKQNSLEEIIRIIKKHIEWVGPIGDFLIM